MPRVGIISDVHSNLEAIEAVLHSLEGAGIDILIHLGDLIGYNANPSECLRLVKSRRIISILGNHDLAALEPQTAETFNVLALKALRYSKLQLNPGDLRYLQSMPRIEVLWDKYLFCHGTPENLQSYIMNLYQAKRTLNLLQRRYQGIHVCFFGHTHVQKLWVRDQRGKVFSPEISTNPLRLEPENLYLLNPGSVGQPRQKDNRAHYAIFDTDEELVWFEAVSYELEKAQRKILEARLPEYLATRLKEGV